MDIANKVSNSINVIQLSGRFDAHEVAPIAAWLKEQVDAGKNQLVVNLTGVNFVDSTALSTLVQGLKHCREKNGDLRLCCLQQSVRVIFELTRLDKAFAIFATEGEATVF
jgi:anti-sigma B factor antagonist